ncbi:hypothetical protein VE04_04665 [Pseudogymnoascus sp. 24MN13]|nr:hypothetical protein VE04_04665 [Pseudogymnoascus sp. 24MN13]
MSDNNKKRKISEESPKPPKMPKIGTNQSLRIKVERLEQELQEAKEDAETANRKYSELLRYIVYTVPQLLAVAANETGNPNLVRNMRQESDDAWDEAAARAEGAHDARYRLIVLLVRVRPLPLDAQTVP